MATKGLLENPYSGINPHLNSKLQLPNRWREFHTTHIVDLRKTLMERVYPMGYTTRVEEGIQVAVLEHPPDCDTRIQPSLTQTPRVLEPLFLALPS